MTIILNSITAIHYNILVRARIIVASGSRRSNVKIIKILYYVTRRCYQNDRFCHIGTSLRSVPHTDNNLMYVSDSRT